MKRDHEAVRWPRQTKCIRWRKGQGRVERSHALSTQASQPVPLIQLVTWGDPAGDADVRALPALLAERGEPAVRAWDRHLPRDGAAMMEQARTDVCRRGTPPAGEPDAGVPPLAVAPGRDVREAGVARWCTGGGRSTMRARCWKATSHVRETRVRHSPSSRRCPSAMAALRRSPPTACAATVLPWMSWAAAIARRWAAGPTTGWRFRTCRSEDGSGRC